MTIRIEHADMLEAIPRLVAEGVVVDAVVTDPPYHLTATTRTSRRSKNRSDPAARLASGFMGQTWDGGDTAFRPETWATVATIMRPGAFLVAFGGTRTYHRLACAIEDAGFVVQDCIMWLFATGFPKRRDNLKPAYEPIVCAYKPGGPRTMQIDECRIGTELRMNPPAASKGDVPIFASAGKVGAQAQECIGRWPANICHDNSDEVLAAFPDSAGQQGDVRGTEPSKPFSGIGKREPFAARRDGKRGKGGFLGPSLDGIPAGPTYNDSSSAARFFFSSKADVRDRWHSRHPTVKPVELMEWLVKLVTPHRGLVLDPFAGSGTTGAAALLSHRDAILIEREDGYVADIRERLAAYEGRATRPTPRRATRRSREDAEGGLLDEC
jgi:site-specific DNA-methyltransferase (adenine-specific)